MEEKNDNPEVEKDRGGRNIFILGIISIVIAVITSLVSLYVYHISGDIYLDRSRPGFLPEAGEEEKTSSKNDDYTFSESGNINQKTLSEYLEHLTKTTKSLEEIGSPFDDKPLSNESLGI